MMLLATDGAAIDFTFLGRGREHHLAIFALDPVSIFIEVNPMHRHDFAVRFSHDAKQCIFVCYYIIRVAVKYSGCNA